MSGLTITPTYTQTQMPGTTPAVATIRVNLMAGSPLAVVATASCAPGGSVNFSNASPGNYTVAEQALDTNGAPIGAESQTQIQFLADVTRALPTGCTTS